MLLCSLKHVEPGVVLAASVMHPSRPDTELIKAGVQLEQKMLSRLEDFGVRQIWIDHDVTADLDAQINLGDSESHKQVYEKLKDGFRKACGETISVGDVASYKQAVMDLVCELVGNPALTTLADRMTRCHEGEPFRHGANVAYLSILIGLELEMYIIKQRPKLSVDNARDLSALGIGAMLHDIGKIAESDPDAQKLNILAAHRQQENTSPDDVHAQQSFKPILNAYREHCVTGYRLLESANAPASARQIVLTHHQRWDGNGFPAMDQVTRGRVLGKQAGEKIHIFSRIVAAADLLDHLLKEADDQGKPAIYALHAFQEKTFKSWMDPIIRDAVLRTVPPFPVGSHVTLSDGRDAVIIAPNPTQPCLPTVRVLEEVGEDNGPGEPLDLSKHRESTITHLLGEKIDDAIFMMTEKAPLSKTLVTM